MLQGPYLRTTEFDHDLHSSAYGQRPPQMWVSLHEQYADHVSLASNQYGRHDQRTASNPSSQPEMMGFRRVEEIDEIRESDATETREVDGYSVAQRPQATEEMLDMIATSGC